MEVFNLQTDAFAAYLQSYEPNYFSDLEIWKLENFRMGIRREFGDTWNLDLRKPDLRKNLDLRMIFATTDFLVHTVKSRVLTHVTN